MTRILALLALFALIIVIQGLSLKEAFASSQGGAQLQLAASRPSYYVVAQAGEDYPTKAPPRRSPAMQQGTLLNLQGPQPLYLGSPESASASSAGWVSPY